MKQSILTVSILSNNVDVIVFTFHEQRYKQCSDKPMGTYITPVPNFLEGYLEYYQQIQQDKGNEDYQLPEAAQYAYCTQKYVNGEEYWLQMGCSDDDTHSIAVNIYTDNTCTKRSTVNGMDDANIDVSEIQVGDRQGIDTICCHKATMYLTLTISIADSIQKVSSLCNVGW